MADYCGEYVLQWEGHARNITEKFSGLLARQSLVDVTLICEEQRIRVHKLVLASCSQYFEEMLEQDLGQEPTILLSDLNFQVLKAMVEFMYCGETSVSKENLEPLLQAARVFKVKELACIAENLIAPHDIEEFKENDADDLEDSNDCSLFVDDDCLQTATSNSESSGNEPKDIVDTTAGDLKNFSGCQAPLSLVEIAYRNVLKFHKEIPSVVEVYLKKMNCDIGRNDESEPVLYEQCCNLVNLEGNVNEYVVNNLSEAEFCPKENCSTEFKEVTRTVDKCLKVYTHKRRKSTEVMEKQFVKTVEDLPEIPIIGHCIDLIDEPSKNETELERDYLVSLSNENVETTIDLVSTEASEANQFCNNTSVDLNKKTRQMKEIFSNDIRIMRNQRSGEIICKSKSMCAPTLRRSVRLSHQENEDSTNNNNNNNNNNNSISQMDKLKDLRKESLKRKNKETNLYCVLDENRVSQNSITKCLDTSRSLRSHSSKLIQRRVGKTCLSFSKSGNREEQKSKGNNETVNNEAGESFSNKFNTIATVSRALWGDMSDCLENNENNIEFSDYSPSKEIPFAVGLLPLRAALERMQATPDYQPRKTRSSVTPFRQEFKGVKRKTISGNVVDSNNCNVNKRHSGANNSHSNNLSGNTVCHVRITTSHSQPVKPRRRLLSEQVDAAPISPTKIVDRQ